MRESFCGLVCALREKGFDERKRGPYGTALVSCRPFGKKLTVPLDRADDYSLAIQAHRFGKYISFTGEQRNGSVHKPSGLKIVDQDILENLS